MWNSLNVPWGTARILSKESSTWSPIDGRKHWNYSHAYSSYQQYTSCNIPSIIELNGHESMELTRDSKTSTNTSSQKQANDM